MKTILLISSLCLVSQSLAKTPDISKFIQLLEKQLKSLINSDTHDPYADLSIEEFVNLNGYQLETHEVITEDGYILTLHRIPLGRNKNSSVLPKPVIVFQHGFQCSSWDFLYLGQNKSLAMLLVDLGYDIWLVNARGNRYSMSHKTFNSSYNSKEFWNFSYHEKGYYDLPASIDYIINKTNVRNVTFIGHSEGTVEGVVLAITRPEYQNKINLLLLLSPVVYMTHTKSPIFKFIYKFRNEIEVLSNVLHIDGIPYNFLSINRPILKNLCSSESSVQDSCLAFLEEAIWGPDYDQFNKSILSFYLANYPAGNSIKEINHFMQEMESEQLRQYNYGDDNLLQYNKTEPPTYDISSIKTPVAVYYGKNDYAAQIVDVERFIKEVPNLAKSKLIDYELFNHLDFNLAIDAKTLVFDELIKLIQIYNPAH